MKLQGKVALITGTSPNICGGIAEGMAEEGAKLVCVDVQPDNANLCADYLNKRGGQAIGEPAIRLRRRASRFCRLRTREPSPGPHLRRVGIATLESNNG